MGKDQGLGETSRRDCHSFNSSCNFSTLQSIFGHEREAWRQLDQRMNVALGLETSQLIASLTLSTPAEPTVDETTALSLLSEF